MTLPRNTTYTTASTQRAFVGAALVPLYEAEAKAKQKASGGDRKSAKAKSSEKSVTANLQSAIPSKNTRTATAHAATAVNVSARSVASAIAVNRDATPEFAALSKSGQIPVSAAVIATRVAGRL